MEDHEPTQVTADLFLSLLAKLDGGTRDEALAEDVGQLQRDVQSLKTAFGLKSLK